MLPFFFIVGFNSSGNTVSRFFWYWLFHGLYLNVLVELGQFIAAIAPTGQASFCKFFSSFVFLSVFLYISDYFYWFFSDDGSVVELNFFILRIYHQRARFPDILAVYLLGKSSALRSGGSNHDSVS